MGDRYGGGGGYGYIIGILYVITGLFKKQSVKGSQGISLGAFCLGELWMFTAGSGIGKSTVVNEIGYDLLMRHGVKLGIMALEESVRDSADRYIGIQLNKRVSLTRQGISQDQYKKAWKASCGNGNVFMFQHFGSTDIDNLMAKIRYLLLAANVDFLILDHISIVVSGLDSLGEGERRMLDILMTRLRSLCEETGKTIIAITHLKRSDKKVYNEGGQVSLTDLRGSASIEQLSDVVVALERDQQGDSPNQAIMRVLKSRPTGRTGVADTLQYDLETGRLLPVDPEALVHFERETDNDDF